MTMVTTLLFDMPVETIKKYYCGLIGKVFKILPLAEENKSSAQAYLNGFNLELDGYQELLTVIKDDPRYVSLLSIIAWLRAHIMDGNCTLDIIKREVFAAIAVCKELECDSYSGGGANEG